MKNSRIYLSLAILMIATVAITAWISRAETEKEAFYARLLNQRGSSYGISGAFMMALWLNDDIAYEVTDPSVWKRVDEWMATHVVEECSIFDSGQLDGVAGGGAPSFLEFSCDVGTLTLYDIETSYNESGELVITDWAFERIAE